MSSSVAVAPQIAPQRIASGWHTLLLVAGLAAMSVASRYEKGLPNLHFPGITARLSSYLTVIAVQWLLVLVIWLGLRKRGVSMATLVAGRWQSAGAFFRDLGLAIGFVIAVAGPILLVATRLAGDIGAVKAAIMPQTGVQFLIWLATAATAGFCEEFVFRGYLTAQFSLWSGSRAFAILLQAVLFGLWHGHYNAIEMAGVALTGLSFGLLANWRKSLRAPMLAHGLLDALGGALVFFTGA